MKNFTKIFMVLVIGFAFGTDMFGQVAASTAASATIITPITITKDADLAFGSIAVGPLAAGVDGTCVVSNAGVKSFTGSCSGPLTGATAASFTITGTDGATFTITIPATVTLANGGNSMTLDTWDNSLGAGPSYTLTGGTQTLNLGGVLNVNAGQATGLYSATFDVEVGYN